MAEELVDRESIHRDLDQAVTVLHQLLADASPADLRRRTEGTRWTNEQLLFHMLFGYLVVRTLLPMVRAFSNLPNSVSRGFARTLNASSAPFHVVNYLGSCGGALVFNHDRMGAKADRVIAGLQRRLDAESEADLRRGMHFPQQWDPYFQDWMTVTDVYRYAGLHFDAHRDQLTL
ncbi:DinB family protein [Lapillicoccus sp.]|uniref:DinB family protein n=1 Tax=Lapillicoccus sp. TaxID=1909287 RepID=UPI0039835DE0